MSDDSIMVLLLLLIFLLVPGATACDTCLRQSKATYFPSSSAFSNGACGYGSMALNISGGYLAAGDSFISRDGFNCGSCFQIRCNKKEICNSKGVKVVLTDVKKSSSTGLMLSSDAFTAMAKHGKAKQLNKLGIVDVEYKRIRCEYKHNLSIRVEEGSHYPTNLTIKFLYQGGKTTILRVLVSSVDNIYAEEDMDQVYGPIWNISPAPKGSLQFRLIVAIGNDWQWLYPNNHVLPVGWKASEIYDTEFQFNKIIANDLQPCSTCDSGEWK